MASPGSIERVRFISKTGAAELLEYLRKQTKVRLRRGIYSIQVVLWLMIVQRLQANGTLASSVEGLTMGLFGGLLPDCKSVREGRISLATGGYCQARQKLPGELVKTVSDELMQRLRERLHEPEACAFGECKTFCVNDVFSKDKENADDREEQVGCSIGRAAGWEVEGRDRGAWRDAKATDHVWNLRVNWFRRASLGTTTAPLREMGGWN